jgi:energy-coupling factor transporter transmembrane protein EcfT
MFTLSLNQANTLADAMLLRGYNPEAKRTQIDQYPFHVRDLVALIFLVFLLGAVITFRVIF